VLASVTADAVARPGWRVNAGASHSLNWLPSERARPIDLYRVGTTMRLADGLDVSGDLSLSSTRPVGEGLDTVTTSRVTTLQTGLGVHAVPVRSFTVNASVRRYRPGEAFQRESQTLTFWSATGDWRGSNRFLLSGGWSLTDAASDRRPDQTMLRAGVQWNPTRRLQASASYNRITQRIHDPATPVAPDRESYAAWVAMSVSRDMSARFQYNEIDPRLPTHARQVVASVTQNFRR
jgi:hypothetical protein